MSVATAAGSILGDNAGAGAGSAGQSGGTGGGSGAGAAGGSGGQGAGAAPSWRDSLPEEIRGDATLSKYGDIQALANAHISLQRMVGADKIPVPGKNASDADWQGVFKKLGLPESVDKYEIKAPDSIKDQGFLKAFKEEALKAGILPQQAEKLLAWSAGNATQAQQAANAQRQQAVAQGIDKLKTEWGEGWDQKVQEAKLGVEWAGGEELANYLKQTGLGNDPQVIKLFNKIGQSLAEGKVRGEGTRSFGLSPDDAQKQINLMMSDANHAYHNKNHADHARSVEEAQRLFQAIHGKK